MLCFRQYMQQFSLGGQYDVDWGVNMMWIASYGAIELHVSRKMQQWAGSSLHIVVGRRLAQRITCHVHCEIWPIDDT